MAINYEIVMPMAGLGQRFKDAGYTPPKPLIEVNQQPLFIYALKSLQPLISESRLTLITYKDDKITESAEKVLNQQRVHYQVIELNQRTQGPAETLFKAKDKVDLNLPLLSLDCDLYFLSPHYLQDIKQGKTHQLCYFESTDPRYSYIKVNEQNQVIDIAEKKSISNKALIGAYFFRNGKNLFSLEIDFMKKEEVYVSHLIKKLIQQGESFKSYSSDQYLSFGTPEELEQSQEFLNV